jgi:hypothetical protein
MRSFFDDLALLLDRSYGVIWILLRIQNGVRLKLQLGA